MIIDNFFSRRRQFFVIKLRHAHVWMWVVGCGLWVVQRKVYFKPKSMDKYDVFFLLNRCGNFS